ncbi:MAG: DEAD/DEAH box helicase [Myxococcales bacterium]|nr:DEAD/DEAH box helicase [Myxococcales bacterium]
MAIELRFALGTLEIQGIDKDDAAILPPSCLWDSRTACFRVPASQYAPVIMALLRERQPYEDNARRYEVLKDGLQVRRDPRPYQEEALAAWKQSSSRGVVVLPTGAGKSHVAVLGIEAIQRDTLIVAPTLDLVAQWYDLLRTSFRCEVGVVGGGEYQVEALTVTTYDSAFLHMDKLGARFGLVVFDECHHLPSDAFSLAAKSCLAPYRLGLTATPERADGRHELLRDLIGPTLFRRDVGELAGDYLADYHVERIFVDLTTEERRSYDEARGFYRSFVESQGIRMSSATGWSDFVMRSAQSERGRQAMRAYQAHKQLAFAAPSKLLYVESLLHKHRRDRMILFTERNKAAYEISRRFLVPVITHQTKVTERSDILQDFSEGHYNVLATSKVLNEGVDIPDANVAVILSGSGSVREHVQRLGRILRKKGDKTATLYELIASGTSEEFTSSRRREHSAYR